MSHNMILLLCYAKNNFLRPTYSQNLATKSYYCNHVMHLSHHAHECQKIIIVYNDVQIDIYTE